MRSVRGGGAAVVALCVATCAAQHHGDDGWRDWHCSTSLNCGEHCRVECPDAREGQVCEARCEDGWYVPHPWIAYGWGGETTDNAYRCVCPHDSVNPSCSWVPMDQNSRKTAGAQCAPTDDGTVCPEARVVPYATACPRTEKKSRNKCYPTCEAGYSRTDQPEQPGEKEKEKQKEKDAFECGGDGRWKGESFRCDPIPDFCSIDRTKYPDESAYLDLVRCDREDMAVGTVCTFACKAGYMHVSGTPVAKCVVDENSDPAWVPEGDDHIQCLRVCPISEDGAGPVANSHFLYGCTPAAGQQCTVRCDEGYKTAGGTGAYKCSASGYGWVPAGGGRALSCKLTGCPDLTFPGNIASGCESAAVGAPCQSQCESGYSGAAANYTCQQNHRWNTTGEPARCRPIENYCPTGTVESAPHVELAGSCRGEVGERCEASCAPGSAAVAGTEASSGGESGAAYRCQADGSWEPEKGRALVCELRCDGVEPGDSRVKIRDSDCKRLPKEYCEAECAEHYQPLNGFSAYYMYRCTQSADGSQAEWQGGLKCGLKCGPGYEPDPGYDPINLNETGSNLPCTACDAGRFSSDGDKCGPCGKHNDERSACYKCPEGQGPNRKTADRAAFTLCEPCIKRQLVSKDGVCEPSSVVPGWIDDEWETPTGKVLTIVGGVIALGLLVLVCTRLRCSKIPFRKPIEREASVLRASFLGGSEKLPAAKLTALDVGARWVQAEQTQQPESWSSATDSLPESPAPGASARAAPQRTSSATRRKRKGVENEVAVMFTNDHVRELQPAEWQTRPLGQGTYGLVYKATWRGQEVAVKVLKLPDLPDDATDAARGALREQVEVITKDFVTEVEVCCDLNHPNLVRLLGFADRPRLMIMQELLRGSSMDRLLYVERWEPTHDQVLQAAYDVARGMEYLHTMFKSGDNNHSQPIIHRDLKSPNLLLATRPTEGEGVLVKVADFGLSRDKALSAVNTANVATAMMTGCGSMLWMAPEILQGDTYNEKVDVFSYAMCLIELVDCHLPWSREGLFSVAAEVPMKVAKGNRPHRQLEGMGDSPVNPRLARLICDCWSQQPRDRPDFTRIVRRLEDMMGIPSRGGDSHSSSGAVASGTGSHSGGGSLTASGAACVGDSQGGESRVSTGMLAPLLETNEEAAEEVAEVALGETRPHSRDPELSRR